MNILICNFCNIELFEMYHCEPDGGLTMMREQCREKYSCIQKLSKIINVLQPERSKREDSDCVINCNDYSCQYYPDMCDHHEKICKYEMRCSEHCGNTMRGK